MTSVLNWIALHRPLRIIGQPVYMIRALLWGRLFGEGKKLCSGYLHRMYRPDADRALHNHPWRWAVAIVLAGGYTEERLKGGKVITRRMRPGRFNFLGPQSFHRITELHGKETWTLFIAGQRVSDWGFMDPERGLVPHKEYFELKGIPE
jgi:hypothetical protein